MCDFIFSSRRRHTRWPRDWSSDVCSSDLVGVAHGLRPGPPASTEESLENVLSQLELYARYGVTTVISLGDEPAEAFEVRDNPSFEEEAISRLFLAGKVLSANTPEEADSLTLAHLDQNPDWLKIRVDDGLGTRQKLPE